MTKTEKKCKKACLTSNPTEVEKICYIQTEFALLNDCEYFNKLMDKFSNTKKEKYFDKIMCILTESINFEKLNYTNNTTFYLMDKKGKIIISYTNGVFSTFQNYINNNAYFYNLSEEQSFLNNLTDLNDIGEIGINLLNTPIANLVVNYLDNPLGILYYLVVKKNKKLNYNFISFIYTLSTH